MDCIYQYTTITIVQSTLLSHKHINMSTELTE